jgi:hypothetical protein
MILMTNIQSSRPGYLKNLLNKTNDFLWDHPYLTLLAIVGIGIGIYIYIRIIY